MGNSHLAAAKLGWNRLADEYPEFSIDFFGFTPGTSADYENHVKAADGSLVAVTPRLQQGFRMTAGGRTQIDGAEYSAFVTFGLGAGGPNFIARSVCGRYRLHQHAEGNSQLLSMPCLTATIEDAVRSEKALLPYRMLRRISDAPVIMQSTPGSTIRIMGDPAYADDPSSVPGLLATIRPIFDDKCRESGQPDLYDYLPQPQETVDPSGLTRDEFIADGAGFSAFAGRTKAGTNTGHGNSRYGEIVMRQVLGALRETAMKPAHQTS